MGACYAVEISLRFKDMPGTEEAAIKALQDYIATVNANFHLDRFAQAGIGTDTFDDLMQIILAGFKNQEVIIEDQGEWFVYSNAFDASYGYGLVMFYAFDTIAKYLKDGSSFKMWPDNDYQEYVVKDCKANLVRSIG